MKIEITNAPEYRLTLNHKEALVLVGVSNSCGFDLEDDSIYFDPDQRENPLLASPKEARETLLELGNRLERLGVRYPMHYEPSE
jgi:hypothetical protein